MGAIFPLLLSLATGLSAFLVNRKNAKRESEQPSTAETVNRVEEGLVEVKEKVEAAEVELEQASNLANSPDLGGLMVAIKDVESLVKLQQSALQNIRSDNKRSAKAAIAINILLFFCGAGVSAAITVIAGP